MSVRVDKWLWAVRVFKTRTSATSACTAGRISVNDEVAKPSTRIEVDDVITVKRPDHLIIYRALQLIEKRVGAKVAAECVDDLSPPKPEWTPDLIAPPGGARERGEGRPTKRDRRRIDRLRGRDDG